MNVKKIKEEIESTIKERFSQYSFVKEDLERSCLLIEQNDFYVKIIIVFDKFYDELRCSVSASFHHKKIDSVFEEAGIEAIAFNSNNYSRYIKIDLPPEVIVNCDLILASSGKVDQKSPIKFQERLPILLTVIDQLKNRISEILEQMTLEKLHAIMNLGETNQYFDGFYEYTSNLVVAYLVDNKNIEQYLKIYKEKNSKDKPDWVIAKYNEVVTLICIKCKITPNNYYAKMNLLNRLSRLF